MNVDDTIAAISSASGGAMRGIVRLSGPGVLSCLADCFRSNRDISLAELHVATALGGCLLMPPPIGELPCDLYLWPDARSYTQQPVAEIHTIGSPPLLDAALQTVCAAGARLAEAGEYTMRAFLAGRMDLTQAEAVLGVIDAHSQNELDIALSQLAGGMAGPLDKLRNQLLDLLAHLEAGLDFVEEDIEFISTDLLNAELKDAADGVARLTDQMTCRGESFGAFRVVLAGWPNVGKSSLLNALGGEQAAIVSKTAGTTRDYVTRRTEIDGLDCLLIDTAGVETDSDSDIAIMAQAASAQQSQQAHVELFCVDATRRLNAGEREALTKTPPANRILVLTIEAAAGHFASAHGQPVPRKHRGRGYGRSLSGESPIGCGEPRSGSGAVADAVGDEIVAAEIRVALDELGKVVGAVHTDDILDRIFSRFCIGK